MTADDNRSSFFTSRPLPLLLDGATGTNLFRAGMPQGACTEQWILEHPGALRDLQKAYTQAGSGAVMAPTFETNRVKLERHGLGDRVAELNARLVALSREAVGDRVLVAGDMSPLGLFIEPFGDATFDDLLACYREQAQALKAAGADYIALETFMGLTEARAALLAAKETGLPVTVTLTVDAGGKTLSGGDVPANLITLAAMGADAVGLNCSTGPEVVLGQLQAAAPYLPVPLIAKPNAGLPVEGRPGEYDITPAQFAAFAPDFLACGTGLLGGCCGTTPETVALLRAALAGRAYSSAYDPAALGGRIFAASEREPFFLTEEKLDFSHKMDCGPDLAEKLIELDGSAFSAARIRLRTPEDANEFGLNAYLISLPVVLLAYDAQALETALKLYQGRAMVDSRSEIEPSALQTLCARYGAALL